jgi:hypothetical protein
VLGAVLWLAFTTMNEVESKPVCVCATAARVPANRMAAKTPHTGRFLAV